MHLFKPSRVKKYRTFTCKIGLCHYTKMAEVMTHGFKCVSEFNVSSLTEIFVAVVSKQGNGKVLIQNGDFHVSSFTEIFLTRVTLLLIMVMLDFWFEQQLSVTRETIIWLKKVLLLKDNLVENDASFENYPICTSSQFNGVSFEGPWSISCVMKFVFIVVMRCHYF